MSDVTKPRKCIIVFLGAVVLVDVGVDVLSEQARATVAVVDRVCVQDVGERLRGVRRLGGYA